MTEAIEALDGHRRDIEYDIPFARIAFGRGVAIGAVSRRLFAVTALGARGLAESRRMRERLWEGLDL